MRALALSVVSRVSIKEVTRRRPGRHGERRRDTGEPALQGGEPPGAAVSRLHLVLLLLSALDLRFIFKS